MMEFFWLVVDLWTCNVSHLTSRQTLGNLTPPWIKVRNIESIGQSAKKEPICFFILTFKQKSVQNICQRFRAFVLSERGNSAVLSLQSGLLLIGGDVELNVLIIESRYQNLLVQILDLPHIVWPCWLQLSLFGYALINYLKDMERMPMLRPPLFFQLVSASENNITTNIICSNKIIL